MLQTDIACLCPSPELGQRGLRRRLRLMELEVISQGLDPAATQPVAGRHRAAPSRQHDDEEEEEEADECYDGALSCPRVCCYS